MHKSDYLTLSNRDAKALQLRSMLFRECPLFFNPFNPPNFIQVLFCTAFMLLPLGQEGQSQGNRWPHRNAAFQCHFPEE